MTSSEQSIKLDTLLFQAFFLSLSLGFLSNRPNQRRFYNHPQLFQLLKSLCPFSMLLSEELVCIKCIVNALGGSFNGAFRHGGAFAGNHPYI